MVKLDELTGKHRAIYSNIPIRILVKGNDNSRGFEHTTEPYRAMIKALGDFIEAGYLVHMDVHNVEHLDMKYGGNKVIYTASFVAEKNYDEENKNDGN